MFEALKRNTFNDELVVVALRMLQESVSQNGIQELNERLNHQQFANAARAAEYINKLAVDLNLDQKFIFDNNQPLRIGIELESGLVQGIYSNKDIPMQVAVFDDEVSDSDEELAVSIETASGKKEEFIVTHVQPGELHPININCLFGGNATRTNNEEADISFVPFMETYKVLCLSTAHLTLNDKIAMESGNPEHINMIMSRDTGFFVKLYNELESNYCDFMSDSLKKIISVSFERGIGMIEFDSDGPLMDEFQAYNW